MSKRPPSLPEHAQALWITGPCRAELRSQALSAAGQAQVLVAARYSGISRGTERLVFEGRVPASEQQRMRAPFQEGELPFPVKFGYASVGEVLAGPPSLLGRQVFCLYPHQSAYVVAADSVFVLPALLPAERAVLAANMETALNALWDAELRAGDRVAVVGAGVVGCLIAYLAARTPGCEVTLVDIDSHKSAVAEALGARFALPDAAPHDCDLVLHASGSQQGLVSALSLAGLEARVIEVSWYGDTLVALPLGAGFHARRLTLRSSQVGRLPASQAARWSHRRRLALALSLLTDPVLDVLLGSLYPFAEAPRALHEVLSHERGELCARLLYQPIQEPC